MNTHEEALAQGHSFQYQDERFADLQLLRYRVDGFEALSLRQKTLVWHLSEAALWGRDILWDQNCRFNLRIRCLLEYIYVYYKGNRASHEFKQFEIYLKRVWFSNGIHHHYATDKFKPEFTREYLLSLIEEARRTADVAFEKICKDDDLETLLNAIFDTNFLAKRVNQTQGEDLLLTSACNYYAQGITQAEAESFYNTMKEKGDKEHPVMFGMNSQLTRNERGELEERIWKEDGMYGNAIHHITEHLEAAIPYAESEAQKDVLRTLVEFYRTGNLETFDKYTIQWVKDTAGVIDFTNGFTEVYGDPLGLKASWEGYVNFTDLEKTQRTERMSAEAQWFEDHSPVDSRFKKTKCKGVTAKVIKAAILGGDLYPSSAIGINLPNSNWVRAEHGSKSVTIGNLTEAYDKAARGNGFREEFVIDETTLQSINQYGDICDDLHTDLHECLGHGSGRLLPGVDPDALKAYGSTIEEARADLFALYYLADKKLVDIQLTPNAEAYKSEYYTYLLNGLLTQLVRIELGNNIEEAHMRNRALIARWVLEHYPTAAELIKVSTPKECASNERASENTTDEKTYLRINDYELLREAFAELLAEVQRIKSEGDLPAAQQLVETYGVKIDRALHQEVLTRYKALNLAPYKGFINPRYEVQRDENGRITEVTPYYDETFAEQMLRYSNDYAALV